MQLLHDLALRHRERRDLDTLDSSTLVALNAVLVLISFLLLIRVSRLLEVVSSVFRRHARIYLQYSMIPTRAFYPFLSPWLGLLNGLIVQRMSVCIWYMAVYYRAIYIDRTIPG